MADAVSRAPDTTSMRWISAPSAWAAQTATGSARSANGEPSTGTTTRPMSTGSTGPRSVALLARRAVSSSARKAGHGDGRSTWEHVRQGIRRTVSPVAPTRPRAPRSWRGLQTRVPIHSWKSPDVVPLWSHKCRRISGETGQQQSTPQPADQDKLPDQRLHPAAPSAGFEPTHTAPEADALSPELRGQEGIG
jgi:hypothetical protein